MQEKPKNVHLFGLSRNFLHFSTQLMLSLILPASANAHEGHKNLDYVPDYRFYQQPFQAKLLLVPNGKSMVISLMGPASLFLDSRSNEYKNLSKTRGRNERISIFDGDFINISSPVSEIRGFESAEYLTFSSTNPNDSHEVLAMDKKYPGQKDVLSKTHQIEAKNELKEKLSHPKVFLDFDGVDNCKLVYKSIKGNIKKRISESLGSLAEEQRRQYADSFLELLATYKINCPRKIPEYAYTKVFGISPSLQVLNLVIRNRQKEESYLTDKDFDVSLILK